MKVNTFISLYDVRTKGISKDDQNSIYNIIVDLIKPVSYISYDNKIRIVEQVIDKNKKTKFPTAEIYRDFIIYLICAYTNIELDKNGFDVLMQSKTMDLIISTFKSEYDICNTLLQMCLDDTCGKDD